MPRFENEDFDPKNRSREDIDRTVPKDEDYYIIHLWMLTLILILKKETML